MEFNPRAKVVEQMGEVSLNLPAPLIKRYEDWAKELSRTAEDLMSEGLCYLDAERNKGKKAKRPYTKKEKGQASGKKTE
jgi:hypothetical protein